MEELLNGRKTIKYRWIFKIKTHDDGEKSPLRKARLVTKMFLKVSLDFLDGFLEERLYVIQPEGFVDPKDANKYASSSDPSMDSSVGNMP